MRRVTLVSLMLLMLAACGIPDQSTAIPSSVSQSAQTNAYPPPDVATPVPTTTSTLPTSTTAPTVVVSVPTATPYPPGAIAPFSVLRTIRLPLHVFGKSAIQWSHDKNQLLYETYNGTTSELAMFDLQSGKSITVVNDMAYMPEKKRMPAVWDEETDTIFYARKNTPQTIDIVAIDTTGKIKKTVGSNLNIGTSDINQTGVVSILINDEIIQNDRKNNQKRLKLPNNIKDLLKDQQAYQQLWFAPDARHFALAYQHDLFIFVIDSDEVVQHYLFDKGVVHHLVWSPDSTALFFRRWEQSRPHDYYGSYVQKITESQPQPLGRGLSFSNVSPVTDGATWSPDSQWIVVGFAALRQCGDSCQEQQIIINPFAPQATPILSGSLGITGNAVWSADMSTIAKPCLQGTQEPYTTELCVVEIKEQR